MDGARISAKAMNNHDLNNLKHRFLFVANEQGIDAAELEFFAALDPLHPKTAALRQALLADLMQNERGEWFYPESRFPAPPRKNDASGRPQSDSFDRVHIPTPPEITVRQEFLYYRIGLLRVRVLREDMNGELAPIDAELYDPKSGLFTRPPGLMNRLNSLDAVKISEAEFYAP